MQTLKNAHAALRSAATAFVVGSLATLAWGQSTTPAVFVSNNGNLEGSVTAFRIGPDGRPQFVNRVITGARATTSQPCAGCNAYEISLSPNGRWLAVAHAAGDIDGLTILEVAADATITQRLQLALTDGLSTPLDVQWIDDEYLLANESDPSPDRLTVYRWNPAGPALTEVGSTPSGTGTSYLLKHPTLPIVYANDSGTARVVLAYTVSPAGALTLLDSETTGAPFALEIAMTPDGRWLYGAGGISSGGRAIVGMTVATDGTLGPLAGSPFTSPGSSPSNVITSRDGAALFAGHGTDATVRSFTIDPGTGALTATSASFDVGLQGTLGDVAASRTHLFVTDNSTATDGLMGVYSFTINPDGTFTPNGPIVSTQGIAPRSLAVWDTPANRLGDMNCDGAVNFDDIEGFVLALVGEKGYAAVYPDCDYLLADADESGAVNFDDISAFVALIIAG